MKISQTTVCEQLHNNHGRTMQNAYRRNSLLFYCQTYSQSSTNISQSWKSWVQIFLFCFFFLFLPLSSSSSTAQKTIACIQMFYISNNWDIIIEVSFLVWSCMQAMTGPKHTLQSPSDNAFVQVSSTTKKNMATCNLPGP